MSLDLGAGDNVWGVGTFANTACIANKSPENRMPTASKPRPNVKGRESGTLRIKRIMAITQPINTVTDVKYVSPGRLVAGLFPKL